MNLQNEFVVPVAVDQAWPVLLDVERVAPCMPGATLVSVDGDEFTGTVKVKIGPVQMTYKGSAKFLEKDSAAHRAVIEASGKEARGSGTAAATVTITAAAEGQTTRVQVLTDLNVTGRPAQFGRGVMAEVAGKLVGQFADCLAGKLTHAAAPADLPANPNGDGTTQLAPGAPTGAVPESSTAAPVNPPQPVQPIDLLDVAGASVARRVVPLVAAVAALVALVVWRRRRG